MQDLKYRDFSRKTDANSRERISDRSESPCTSNLCKEIQGKTEEAKQFLKILPHQYYEENNLHGLDRAD